MSLATPAIAAREIATELPAGPRQMKWRLVMLAACVAIVLPIWIVPYPPIVDYPNMLARSVVLRELHNPANHFARYFYSEWSLYPYLTTDVILIALQSIVAPRIAGKILLSICALSFPMAGMWFVRKVSPGTASSPIAILLLAYGTTFLFGFLNYFLSLGLLFVALGLWTGFIEQPSVQRYLGLSLLLTALYLTHLMGFGLAGVIMFGYCVLNRLDIRTTMLSASMFAPGAAMFLASRTPGEGSRQLVFGGLKDKLLGLASLFRGYTNTVDVITYAVLLAVLAWVWHRDSVRWNRPWGRVLIGLIALYAIFPKAFSAGWDADKRILPVVFVIAVVTIRPKRWATQVAVVFALLFALRYADVLVHFQLHQHRLAEVASSLDAIPNNARVLPVVSAKKDRQIQRSYVHAWAYGVLDKSWFSPYLFTAKGIQPLRMREGFYAPEEFWDYRPQLQPDWARVAQDYDYLWVYGAPTWGLRAPSITLSYESSNIRVFRIEHQPGEHHAVFTGPPLRTGEWPRESAPIPASMSRPDREN